MFVKKPDRLSLINSAIHNSVLPALNSLRITKKRAGLFKPARLIAHSYREWGIIFQKHLFVLPVRRASSPAPFAHLHHRGRVK